jgi:hypothetical protein
MKLRLTEAYAIQIGEAYLSIAPQQPYVWTNKEQAAAVADFLVRDLPPDSPVPVVVIYKTVVRS